MNPIEYFKKFEPQLFRFWDDLTAKQKEKFENQLAQIDLQILQKQQELIANPTLADPSSFEPFHDFAYSGNVSYRKIGQALIQKGAVGCLLLAGGQGTRLGHTGPKGTYPILPGKSLFQLCAEKVLAASNWAKHPLQLAIMTSKDNDAETRAFFQQHQFFGLNSSQISFFNQGSLPFLEAKGHLFLQTPWQIAEGANGNGESLLHLAHSGILQKWNNQGIEMITVIPVDNPLADPFDPELIGFHADHKNEITLKCAEKKDPEEKVGVVVKKGDRCTIIEYMEFPESEKNARQEDGTLKHRCANLGLFCFSLSFIQKIVKEGHSLPLHQAWKKTQTIDNEGLHAWKFETFIFDWLNFASRVEALIYPREECFAPLKNLTGADSPETVRRSLKKFE